MRNISRFMAGIDRPFTSSHIVAFTLMLLFALFLAAQMNMVFMYHDDWGLSVLWYVPRETGFQGQDFSQFQLVRFSFNMYKLWTGRAVPLFIEIELFKIGIAYVRTFQIIVILLAVLLAGLIGSTRTTFLYGIAISILCYLAIPGYALRGGIYWYSAASVYLWGIPLVLLGVWQFQPFKTLRWSSVIPLAASAAFNEVLGVAASSIAIAYLIGQWLEYRDRSVLRTNALRITPILISTMVFILAPGNFNRLAVTPHTEGHFLANLVTNLDQLTSLFIHNGDATAFGIAFVISFCFGLASLSSLYSLKFVAKFIAAILISGILVLLLAKWLAFVHVTLAYLFVQILHARKNKDASVIPVVFIGALASLVMLLPIGGLAPRSLIPFFFMSIPAIAYPISTLAPAGWKSSRAWAMVLIAVPAALNAAKIYGGYKDNYAFNLTNDQKLEIARFELQHDGIVPTQITLYKLPRPEYAEVMPYQRPLIESWMKQYYSLPQQTSFVWK